MSISSVIVGSSILLLLAKQLTFARDVPTYVKCTTPECENQAEAILRASDFRVNPCDDFYKYACDRFPELNPIPEGRTLWDNFQILQNVTDYISRDILSATPSPNDFNGVQKAKKMYNDCINTTRLDEIGLTPLITLMENVGGWPLLSRDWDEEFGWTKLGAVISEYGVPMVFDIIVRANLFNANKTIIYLEKPSLALPVPITELEFTLEDLLLSKEQTDSNYTLYLQEVAVRLRDEVGSDSTNEEILSEIREVLNFMRDLASATPNNSKTEDSPIKTFRELQDWTDSLSISNEIKLDWLDFFQQIYSKTDYILTPDDTVLVSSLDLLKRYLEIFSSTNPRTIANFVVSRLMTFFSPETDSFMRDAAFNFYKQQNYVPPSYERWQYCVHKVNDYPKVGLSMAVAQKFLEQNFQISKLSKAADLVSDLREAFKELLEESSWMDEATRLVASKKVDAMVVLAGFPTWINDSLKLDQFYEKLEVVEDGHFGNVYRLRAFMQAVNLKGIASDRDRYEWTQSPLIVNAFYNGLNNRMTFPAGIMQDPFFSSNNIGALDYGRIGAIIGHEITHGFDSSGRSYSSDGTVTNWWSDETSKAFSVKELCFIYQYKNYWIPEINQTVNGDRTCKENVADNGGVRQAYRAFQKLRSRNSARGNARLPGLEQFTPDQLFFMAYATVDHMRLLQIQMEWGKWTAEHSMKCLFLRQHTAPPVCGVEWKLPAACCPWQQIPTVPIGTG